MLTEESSWRFDSPLLKAATVARKNPTDANLRIFRTLSIRSGAHNEKDVDVDYPDRF